MGDRWLILSDLHIGLPGAAVTSVDQLRPLWRGVRHVVINGDLAEPEHAEWRIVAEQQKQRLIELSATDGFELTLICGNHDPRISDVNHITLAGGQVLVMHGDVLHPSIAPWGFWGRTLRDRRERALAQLAPNVRDTLDGQLAAVHDAVAGAWRDHPPPSQFKIMHMLLKPTRLIQMTMHWWREPTLASRFVRRHAPQVEFIVLGHSHRQTVRRADGRTTINTGSFHFPGRPRAVIIDAKRLTVWRIHRRKDRFRLADKPLADFTLDPRS